MLTDTYDYDIVFDPEDVDLGDLINLSIGIHETMCPEIVEESQRPRESEAGGVLA